MVTPLSNLEQGCSFVVSHFLGGRGVEDKLQQFGLLPGDKAFVVRTAPFGGPLIILIDEREVAVGHNIAKKIMVEEV